MRRSRWLGIAALLTAGCVARDAAEPRFFRLDVAAPPAAATSEAIGAAPSPAPYAANLHSLHLRSVTGAPFLRERIVWRSSPVEYHFYEQRRWLELPAAYVERSLVSSLRATGAVILSDDGTAPALTAEVDAFDEVRSPAHVAQVSVHVVLRGSDRRPLLDQAFTVDEPIVDDDPLTMTRAMGHAVGETSSRIATAVAASLVAAPPSGR